MTEFIKTGFDELEAHGYTSVYINIEHEADGTSVILPSFDLAACMSVGYPKGTKVRFLNKNGYDIQRENALKAIGDMVVTVKHAASEVRVLHIRSTRFLETLIR